jgi:hypothetical protein
VPVLQGISAGQATLFTERTASILLVAVDDLGNEDLATKARLQYFPETLSDTRSPEWEAQPVPGGSHPIYNWVTGGERLINFMAAFTQERRLRNPLAATSSSERATSQARIQTLSFPQGGPVGTVLADKWSVDIVSAVAWLRQFTYPTYGADGQAFPPRRVRLVAPNSVLGGANFLSDSVLCIMQGCDVEYLQWWPDGVPKYATVSLSFAELAQSPTSVAFQSSDFLRLLGRTYVAQAGSVVAAG